MWCPGVAPRKPPHAPCISSQEASQPAASEPGPSTPLPAQRSKRIKAEQAAEPTKGKGKDAKAKPARQPGRWLDRDCNAALGESTWRPLEPCWWPEEGKLPAKGKEYPGLGYKRVRDKPPKTQPAVAQYTSLLAKRSKRTKAEQAAEPSQPTKGKGKAQALNMQRIGESRWWPLELCYWPDQPALPAKGKEYPGLGYKRLRDKPPKAQQQQQLVVWHRPTIASRLNNTGAAVGGGLASAGEGVASGLNATINTVQGVGHGAVDAVQGAANATTQLVQGVFVGTKDAIEAFANGTKNTVEGVFVEGRDLAAGAINSTTSAIKVSYQAGVQKGKDIVGATVGGIATGVGAVAGATQQVAEGVGNTAANITTGTGQAFSGVYQGFREGVGAIGGVLSRLGRRSARALRARV
ncbi:hypothetical protein QJQ45_012010 [Haematococcus lacustris]|nr:hypothetical protein QJQ45_012010 [Haematococcus lacustris]